MNKNALIPRRKVLGLGVALAGLCAGCAVLPDAGSARALPAPGGLCSAPPVLRKRHRGPSSTASTCGTTRSSTPFTTTAAW